MCFLLCLRQKPPAALPSTWIGPRVVYLLEFTYTKLPTRHAYHLPSHLGPALHAHMYARQETKHMA